MLKRTYEPLLARVFCVCTVGIMWDKSWKTNKWQGAAKSEMQTCLTDFKLAGHLHVSPLATEHVHEGNLEQIL
jgi:hypothetical protein